jgi:hypothetical protein
MKKVVGRWERCTEGVEAEADVGAVCFLYEFPDAFPGWGVGYPALVFVCEMETVGGGEVG